MKFVIEIEMENEMELADQYSAAADMLLAIEGVTLHKFNVVSAKFEEAKAKWNNHPPGCRGDIMTTPLGRNRSAVPDIHKEE